MSYLPDKITQTAACFLLKANGKLPYIVLIKLMYYADKQMLLQYGEPITFDRWVSMKNGPVLSNTLNLIRMPDETVSEYWSNHLAIDGYDIIVNKDPGDDLLSELEEEVIDHVFQMYADPSGVYDDNFKWKLVNDTHKLPEWDKCTGIYGGSSDIPYDRVLRLAGVNEKTIETILSNIRGVENLHHIAEAQ